MPSLGCDLNSYKRSPAGIIVSMNLDFSDKNPDLGELVAQNARAYGLRGSGLRRSRPRAA